jgi:hypothetical protein
VPLPDAGVYIIEVLAYSEGGDGAPSSQIRVPSYSGKFSFPGLIGCPSPMQDVVTSPKSFERWMA